MRKTYIFDFDGTLVDSMPTWIGKMYYVLETCHITPPEGLVKIIVPLGDRGTADYFRNVLHVPLSVEEMIARMDSFALPKYRDEVKLKDGVFACLHRLKEQGACLNVLTASPHKMVDPCLQREGVYHLFDNVWSCDDFGLTKSTTAIYLEAAKHLGVSPADVVFVDDSLIPVKTAKEAGMFSLAVYDDSTKDSAAEIKQVADRYMQTLNEL